MNDQDDYVDDDLDQSTHKATSSTTSDPVEAAVNPGSFAKLTLLAIALRAFELPH
jgi:hypothetical protein